MVNTRDCSPGIRRFQEEEPKGKDLDQVSAAELLGLKPTTLLSRIKKMGIVK
jgi:transcriptional regulator with GAF, ATPase, and Fis domain